MKVFRFLLFPFTIIYGVVMGIRNFLFDKKMFSSTRFPTPIITVGNLSVGGTGKTPQIEYLIRLLQSTKKIAVLSRGYKRTTKGLLMLNNTHTAQETGDEPLQYFKKFTNITVAVDEDRVHGVTNLLELPTEPEVILLDDAYQHRKIQAGYQILLTKYTDLYVDDYLLPTGNLRECRGGASRANAIIVSKCPTALSTAEQKKITQKIAPKTHQKVFFTTISYADTLKGSETILVDNLKNYEVLLVTGIANPTLLTEYLSAKKIRISHLEYPDHHFFTQKDIRTIQTKFNTFSSKNKIIITTEKDYVRLAPFIKKISFVEIQTTFLGNQSAVFDKEILDFVNKK